MTRLDFDFKIQKIFNEKFSNIQPTNWKKWLDIPSRQDYEELALKNSGLTSIDDIFERITREKVDSKALSIDLDSLINETSELKPLIACHSSGTTNHKISALKWMHMSNEVVRRYWAPGMQAIFESSGLNSRLDAVIFVPSRLKIDGLKNFEDKKYISLYSSEFSQRLMLSIIKPNNYTLFEYKKSKSLDIIAKILSLEKISTLSAPALTILGWADLEKLQLGLQKSLKFIQYNDNNILEKLYQKVERLGIKAAAKEIQELLSKKVKNATIVFSTSSLSEKDWQSIRKFMKWEQGKERFINLYVSTETGPFAASITKDSYESSRQGNLYVFPLTLPSIENKGRIQLISRAKNLIGNLLVSRLSDSKEFINVKTGDVIEIVHQKAIPQIKGKILRSNFQLKSRLEISQELSVQRDFQIYVGDFFNFNNFDFYDPRNLLNCLNLKSNLEVDFLILKKETTSREIKWILIIPLNGKSKSYNSENIIEVVVNCVKNETLKTALLNHQVEIVLLEKNPINITETRNDMLEKVRKGEVAKGILKKWPLYVIES
ncbi:MAG: hypothetical protein ACXABO_20725 [Promethearchaeota archaeon]